MVLKFGHRVEKTYASTFSAFFLTPIGPVAIKIYGLGCFSMTDLRNFGIKGMILPGRMCKRVLKFNISWGRCIRRCSHPLFGVNWSIGCQDIGIPFPPWGEICGILKDWASLTGKK